MISSLRKNLFTPQKIGALLKSKNKPNWGKIQKNIEKRIKQTLKDI